MTEIELQAGYLYEYMRAHLIHAKLMEDTPGSQQNLRQQGINTIIERMKQFAHKAYHKGIADEKGLDVYWDVNTEESFNKYCNEL